MVTAGGGISSESRNLGACQGRPRAVGASATYAAGGMAVGIGRLPSPVQLGDGGEQVPGIGVLGVAEDFFGVAHLDHGAVAEDDRTIAYVVAQREVVGDKKHRQALALQRDQHVEHVHPSRSVKHADDLIGDEKFDVQQQCPSHEEALLLPARKLMRELVYDVGRVEGDRLQGSLYLFVPLVLGEVAEVLLAHELEDAVRLVQRVVGAERILEDPLHIAVVVVQLARLQAEDVGAVENDSATRGRYEAEDDLAQGRFPAPALTDERHDLALVDVEAHLAQGRL